MEESKKQQQQQLDSDPNHSGLMASSLSATEAVGSWLKGSLRSIDWMLKTQRPVQLKQILHRFWSKLTWDFLILSSNFRQHFYIFNCSWALRLPSTGSNSGQIMAVLKVSRSNHEFESSKNIVIIACFLCFKVHIFWEGHKILQNLHRRFDRY